LAALFGFLLSGGAVLLLEKMDTTIRRPDDLKEHGYSIIGAVPSMDEQIRADFEGKQKVDIDGQSVNTSLTMLLSPMSPAAESYRRIRSNLQFARPDKEIQVVSVSSAGKGAGKTTTSMNLALAMASAGKETLIVDADLRRPRLHLLLDLADRPYLSDLLFEDVDLDKSALATTVDNLSVLPANSAVPNPAEILGSERMAAFVDRLRQHYDFVIFDTAPLLLFSDSVSLSKRCDGTILVAGAGETDIRAFEHAAAMLNDVNVDLIGCVLNRYDADTIEYGYGYGYAYSHDRMEDYYGVDMKQQKPQSPLDKLRSWL
jgi:capsular exopolysaccharide synthesis family protein